MNAGSDERAFAALVRSHYPELIRIAVALTGSRAAARELVHATLIAFTMRGDLSDPCAVFAMLLAEARAWPSTPLAAAPLARAIAELPADERVAITMRDVLHWPLEQIAACTRIDTSEIRARLARGRARLRSITSTGL